MSDIALFHSALGVRQGVLDAAERLEGKGHRVHTVDQYDGRVFADYVEAAAYVESIGYPALLAKALEGTSGLPDGFVAAGFSNGGGMAEFVASQRPVSGVIMFSGALPVSILGLDGWPAGVAAQIHYMQDDPFRAPGHTDEVAESVRAAGADVEVFDYPGHGHLFTDASLPDEYDAQATALLWEHVDSFLARITAPTT